MITVTAEFKFVIQYTNSRNSMNFVHLHGIMVIDIKCGVHQQGNSIVVKLGKEVMRDGEYAYILNLHDTCTQQMHNSLARQLSTDQRFVYS